MQNSCNTSILASIIDQSKLKYARRRCIEMASQWEKMKQVDDCTFHQNYGANGDTSGGMVGFTFSKSMTEQGNERGPRGGLIPKTRPDVAAKPTGLEAALLRGGKNRKNKKKQMRDIALKEFVTTMTS